MTTNEASFTPPEHVLLCSIQYNVSVSEHIITFKESSPVFGCRSYMHFQRGGDKHDLGWFISFSNRDQGMYLNHVLAASQLVMDWYGGTFDKK